MSINRGTCVCVRACTYTNLRACTYTNLRAWLELCLCTRQGLFAGHGVCVRKATLRHCILGLLVLCQLCQQPALSGQEHTRSVVVCGMCGGAQLFLPLRCTRPAGDLCKVNKHTHTHQAVTHAMEEHAAQSCAPHKGIGVAIQLLRKLCCLRRARGCKACTHQMCAGCGPDHTQVEPWCPPCYCGLCQLMATTVSSQLQCSLRAWPVAGDRRIVPAMPAT